MSELTGCPPKGRVVTVRLTTRCLYQCRHCCYECGPRRRERMSLDIAKQVRPTFEGHVTWLNVMGGEITLLPDYEQLLEALHFVPLRVVTNGWWVDHKKPREKLLRVLRKFAETEYPLNLGISRDRFHPEGVGERAAEWLRQQDPQMREDWGFSIRKDIDQETRAIAPVGRAWENELGDPVLRMFGAYCAGHAHLKSMTVLEDGRVTFCQFGAWPMGYLRWGFDRLEEVRLRISKVFISNCTNCWYAWKYTGAEQEAMKNLERDDRLLRAKEEGNHGIDRANTASH